MANTNLFNIFVVVAEQGSITRAAEKLFISQPAITKSIKQLESELGGQLFERKNRGVVLTTGGKVIYDKVKPLMVELDGIYGYFDSVNKLKTGVLRIGTNTSNVNFLLAKAINKFINKHPNIEIKIKRDKESRLVSQLKNNEIDLAVIDDEHLQAGLRVVKSFGVNYSVVGSKKYFLKYQKKPLSKEAFAAAPLALIGAGHTSRANIDSYFSQSSIVLKPKYEMDNYGLIIDFIKRGLAIGVVNLEYFTDELERGEIYELNTDFKIDSRNILVVSFDGENENPAKKNFIKFL